MEIQPWHSKTQLKRQIRDCKDESYSSLKKCLTRHLEDRSSDPEKVIDYLIWLCGSDTDANVRNREKLEEILNAKYEKPKRKKRTVKRR